MTDRSRSSSIARLVEGRLHLPAAPTLHDDVLPVRGQECTTYYGHVAD
ncbi:hypothetical protein [Paracoccus sp. S3-43]|nr:hypothetical protein [Paracoccus sp. S3-43]WEF23247.1 hypothetical protein PXD02_10465 [Paracoccus sp. S3-43]